MVSIYVIVYKNIFTWESISRDTDYTDNVGLAPIPIGNLCYVLAEMPGRRERREKRK